MLTDPGPVQVTHLVVSWAAYYVFCLWGADLSWDLLGCFERTEDGAEVVVLRTSAQLDTPVKTLEVSSFPSDLGTFNLLTFTLQNALLKQSKYLKKLEKENTMKM